MRLKMKYTKLKSEEKKKSLKYETNIHMVFNI